MYSEWKDLQNRNIYLLELKWLYDMVMSLRSADLYLWYDWLDMEWYGEFALLFQSERDHISGTCKL